MSASADSGWVEVVLRRSLVVTLFVGAVP